MYNSNECYFPNCWAEMGRKLWKNQDFFPLQYCHKLDFFGQRWWVFCFERASLNQCCTTILHLIFLTLLKQAVLRAWGIMKSNCLRFVSYVVQPSSLPSAHAHIRYFWLCCVFLLWPSKWHILCSTISGLVSCLLKGLNYISLSHTRVTDLHKTSHNLMVFRSLSNLIEREQGVWKLLGLGGLTACLHKTYFHRKPGKKLNKITCLSSVICATQI